MNMDILLSENEENNVIGEFIDRYIRQYGGRPPSVEVAKVRRRAQVRKVVKWIEERERGIDTQGPNWQALCAAAEGKK